MTKKVLLLAAVIIGMMVLLTGCFPNAGLDETVSAGFFWGFWHGIISPISLIGTIFNSDISIFEVNNSGFWYNLGFFLSITGGVSFGSFTIGRIRIGRRR